MQYCKNSFLNRKKTLLRNSTEQNISSENDKISNMMQENELKLKNKYS